MNLDMRTSGIFIAVIVFFNVLVFPLDIISQTKQTKKESSVLIRRDRPSVYIEFERVGTEEPFSKGESSERVWLKIENNTHWEIQFCSFEVKRKYGNIGVVYNIDKMPQTIGAERNSSNSDKKTNITENLQVPEGYGTGDTCTPFHLVGGKSTIFSVPKEHLAKDLNIRIEFWYEWENRDNLTGNYPNYFVTYDNNQFLEEFDEKSKNINLNIKSQLPKNINRKLKP